MSDTKKTVVCMSPINPFEYAQAGSTERLFAMVDGKHLSLSKKVAKTAFKF